MKNNYSLKDIAEFLQAQWSGDANVMVDGIASLEHAEANHLSFLSKKQFAHFLERTAAGIVIVRHDVSAPAHLNIIKVADAYLAYAQVSQLFCKRIKPAPGVHPTAHVEASAQVSASASVGPHCVIGAGVYIGANSEIQAGVFIGANSRVGDDCVIYANAAVYHGVNIGNRVTIHACAVIGADGFGFAQGPNGWTKIYQLGGVSIGDDVEIGAGATIDRGALDNTVIESGVIIDDQVHVAHNCKIGRRTAIAGCAGIAGSTHIGEDCTIGGMVAISGHLTIANNVHFNGSTIVTKSISEPGVYGSGTVIQDVKTWRKNAVRFGQLDQWVERIKKLEQDQ